MKFWRLVISRRFRKAWGLLSRRPDSEHEQALIRVVINLTVFSYLYFIFARDGGLQPWESQLLLLCGSYFGVSIILFSAIVANPSISHERRAIGICGDLGLSCYAIAHLQDGGGLLYVILLWVMFGNGFRYGRTYLFASAVFGTAGFSLAVYHNPYWGNRPLLAGGMIVGLVVLPLYVSLLLKKLTAAAKRAEEANQAKNRFLANMSHEMRTPLNGIIGLIDLLKGTPLTGEQEELTKTVDASARTLLFLMQDVLDLSKIEAGKVSVQVSDFDLYGLVKNTLAILEPQARSKGLDLFLHVPANVPFLLRGDPLLLRQVLLNLLGNAVKFTDRGEVGVRLSLESETPWHATVRFEVADTGIGIAPDAQRRIFDRFAQADESITRRYGGTGLGTTISQEIVGMMGGQIGVRSAPGQGSTFWFILETEKQPAAQGEGAVAATLDGRRALVVSADPSVTETVREHLAAWGVRTATVDRTAQAFAQLVSASNVGVPFDFVVVAEHGLDTERLAFARVVKSDPTIHNTQLVLVTEGREDADPGPKGWYSASLPAPVDRRLLFNALHFSRPDAAAIDTTVGNLADQYRKRHEGGRKLRVLVAEDNRTNQMVIAKILERAGHEAVLVGDGEQALEALKSRSFDITLMDLHMPVMGGVEATKLYRFMNRTVPRMPIVALTADATAEAQAECREAGMDVCLTKPVDTQKLFDLFDELVPGSAPAPRGAENAPAAVPAEKNGTQRIQESLDPRVLQELTELGGNGDFVVRLAWTFLKGAKERLRDLEKAVGEDDVEGARQAAHALKGNSGQIGAFGLMRACDRFSGIGAPELARVGGQYLDEVREELSRARVALDHYLQGRDSAVS